MLSLFHHPWCNYNEDYTCRWKIRSLMVSTIATNCTTVNFLLTNYTFYFISAATLFWNKSQWLHFEIILSIFFFFLKIRISFQDFFVWLIGFFWYINTCRLFNAKSCLYVVPSISFQTFLYRHLKLSVTLENSVCYCYTSYEMTDQFLWFQV